MHKKITFVTGCSGELLSTMKALIRAHRHPDERSFQGVLTVAPEQQHCGVQVVEWVGLAGLFRAVFAEEIGGFGVFAPDGII